jgi:hypothetical protein
MTVAEWRRGLVPARASATRQSVRTGSSTRGVEMRPRASTVPQRRDRVLAPAPRRVETRDRAGTVPRDRAFAPAPRLVTRLIKNVTLCMILMFWLVRQSRP